MAALEDFLTRNSQRFEQELCELLRIPSVSTDDAFRPSIAQAAQWIAEHLRRLGLSVQVFPTARHPVVYAESPPIADRPVVLVYGHYDVQPADPLDEWLSPPFEPAPRDGNLYARGATDDKGQLFTHIKSVEAWLGTAGQLPLQVKFLIEGEEEIGSPNLEEFVRRERERLRCDCVVISDSCQFAPGIPAITYGLRGIAYYELRLQGPRQDLHSGTFGGAVTNPANALCRIVASLTDARGRVCVPGFYDDVVPLSERERLEFRQLPFDEGAFRRQIGVAGLSGEEGFSTLERRWARPTCDVNGLKSGYQGQGAKTVLPASAVVKFSFRLVPNQDPQKIDRSLRAWLESRCPAGIQMQLESFHGAPAVVVPLESPYVEAASRAIELGFGRRPVFIREGGSIPVVGTLREVLGVDTLLLGWGLNDDNTHGPNEKFSLADFHRGTRASAYLWRELAALER